MLTSARLLTLLLLLSLVALGDGAAWAQAPAGFTLSSPGGRNEARQIERDPPTATKGVAPTARLTTSWPDVDNLRPRGLRFRPSAKLPTAAQVRTMRTGGTGAALRAIGPPPPGKGVVKQLTVTPASRFKKLPSPRPGQTLTYDGTQSDDVDGTIVAYEWSFARRDGLLLRTVTRSGPTVELPTEPDTVSVRATLTVVDSDGNKATSVLVTGVVANKPPVLTLDRMKKYVTSKLAVVPAGAAGNQLGVDASVPQYTVKTAGTNAAIMGALAQMKVEEGFPTRVFANGADADGQIVDYAYDIVGADGDFEEALGATDEFQYTPTDNAFAGKQKNGDLYYDKVIRVRATDDEGASTVAELPLQVFKPCLKADSVQLTTNVKVWKVNGCLTKPTPTSKKGVKQLVLTDGTMSLNGLEVTAAEAKIIVGGDAVIVSSKNAMVTTVDPDGARIIFAAGPVNWTIIGGVFLVGPRLKDATVGGLPVAGAQGTPSMKGNVFSARILPGTPAVYGPGGSAGGPTATQAVSFKALTPDTSAATLRADVPDLAFSYGPTDLEVGGVQLENVYISFDGDDTWKFGGQAVFGPKPTPPDTKDTRIKVTVDASIIDGDFGRLHGNLKVPNGVVLPPGLTLYELDFEMQRADPKPTECVPHIGKELLSLQPLRDLFKAFGFSDADVASIQDIQFDYKIPDFQLCGVVDFGYGSAPTGKGDLIRGRVSVGYRTYPDGVKVFGVKGKLNVLAIPINLLFESYNDGYLHFSADAKFSFLGGDIKANGGIDFQARTKGKDGGKFNAKIYAEVNIKPVKASASGTVILSSKGIGACLGIDTLIGEWTPGATKIWGGAFTPYFQGCDIGDVVQKIKKGGNVTSMPVPPPGTPGLRQIRAAGDPFAPGDAVPYDIPVPPTGIVAAVTGVGGLAHFAVIDPTGKRYEATAVDDNAEHRIYRHDEQFHVFKDPETNTTNVVIKGTQPVRGLAPLAPRGRWQLQLAADSVPASTVVFSNGVQKPQATARLARGAGGTLSLAVTAKDSRPGIVANVMDAGPSGSVRLGSAALTAGTARTLPSLAYESPAQAAGEPREVWVYFERNGLPVGTVRVGKYSAPAPPAPKPVTGLKVRPAGTSIVATWDKAPGAASYLVALVFDDGRRTYRTVTTNGLRESVSLRKDNAVKVSVVPISAKGRRAAVASTTLARRAPKAVPKLSPAARQQLMTLGVKVAG
jgi:hypothetical protein